MAATVALSRAAVGRCLLLFTVVVWGWSFVATKVCLRVLTPVEVIGLRFALAVPVLALVARLRGARLRADLAWRPLLLGAALLTAHFLIQVHGLVHTSAVRTGWIIAVTPLVLALLARLLLGEPLTRWTAAGVAVATVGVLILVTGGRIERIGWQGSVGEWLVLGSAHTWALYTLAVRGASRSQDPLVTTLIVTTPVALLTAVPTVAAAPWSRPPGLTAEVVAALAFLGIVATALAHWFWQEGVARVGAAQAGFFLYLEPLATTALAVPLLGEPAGAPTLAGGALVLAGVALSQAGGLHRLALPRGRRRAG